MLVPVLESGAQYRKMGLELLEVVGHQINVVLVEIAAPAHSCLGFLEPQPWCQGAVDPGFLRAVTGSFAGVVLRGFQVVEGLNKGCAALRSICRCLGQQLAQYWLIMAECDWQ